MYLTEAAIEQFPFPCSPVSKNDYLMFQNIFSSMMMMMMMMNYFCGMVDRRKAFSLISSRDHCQRSSPSPISDTPRAGFEHAQNLSSGLVVWSCAVVITTTPQRHNKIPVWFLYDDGDNTGYFHTAVNEAMKPIFLLFNDFHRSSVK